MPFLKKISEGFLIQIHVQPQASKTQIIGLHGDRLKIKIKAPPVDGAANDEILSFLAKTLDLPKRNLVLKAGQTSRQKTILVATDDEENLRQRLKAP